MSSAASEYLLQPPKYNLLYEAFGWDIPTYMHCPPVMKDAHPQALQAKRRRILSGSGGQGLPQGSRAQLHPAARAGAPRARSEIFTLPRDDRGVRRCSGISKSPAIFDPAKLRYINGEYIRAMSPEAVFRKSRAVYRTGSSSGTTWTTRPCWPRCCSPRCEAAERYPRADRLYRRTARLLTLPCIPTRR